jgi:hypothetical protein
MTLAKAAVVRVRAVFAWRIFCVVVLARISIPAVSVTTTVADLHVVIVVFLDPLLDQIKIAINFVHLIVWERVASR